MDVNDTSHQPMDIVQTSTTSAQPVASLKNKKAVFKQQPLGLDQAVSTISERLNFHTQLQTATAPLTTFPSAHLPLIAKLVHESEETFGHAATRVHKLLAAQIPSGSSGDGNNSPILPKSVIEAAVKTVADRVNWGVDNGVAGATIWRLEAKDRGMLPPEFQQVCEERWKERNQAKLDLQAALAALPDSERAQFVKSTGNKVPADEDAVMKSPSKGEKTGEASSKKASGKAKKPIDPEVVAKEKEKQEKKTAKVEKEKKVAENTKKTAAAFASFFTPARPAAARVKTDDVELSDYDKTFHSFVVRKNTVCAPINRFVGPGTRPTSSGSSSGSGDLLRQFLDSHSTKSRTSSHLSSRPRQNLEVRAIMNELNDAEVVGDSKTVRRLTLLLANRRAIPAKLFQFHENKRPAYYGTWTKSSPNIRPRRPLGKDESLDYDYDSGEDWEEEGDGEVIVSDGSDEEDSDSDADEEGWLVDDDEAEEVSTDAADDSAEATAKRKAKGASGDKDKDGKRRKIEKLAPFQKGPCWEEEIAQCTYDAFNPYRIQLLNDCPYPVDPFTFLAEPFDKPAQAAASGTSAVQTGSEFSAPVPPSSSTSGGRVVPLGPSNRVASVAKKTIDPGTIKNPFPDAHLAELYGLIEGSEKTLKGLVEDLYLALKKYPGVKKYAIEAKLREVADKGRSADAPTKRWRVSDEAWAAIGATRPSQT